MSNLDGYGLSRQLDLLVTGQQSDGQRTRVIAMRSNRDVARAWRKKGIDLHALQQRWVRDPFVAARLLAELRRQDYDLLHLWGQPAAGYGKLLQKFAPRKPVVCWQAAADLPLGIETSPSPNLSRANLSRQGFLQQLNLPGSSKLFAVAGKLLRSQNIDEAIWHFELIRTLDEEVRLLVFGDGPDRHRLERFARRTTDLQFVRFLGYRSDFRQLLQHVDLFWHTADQGRAIPQTVLEAMAAGVPVVANETTDCQGIIDREKNGYLVPDNDRAIFARYSRKLMHDRQHRQQIIDSAQSTARQFSVDAMLDAYADRYKDCLSAC